MLNPSDRISYVDELRPPDGYMLDYALATTYSLDLLTLLTAPLSMALFECESQADVVKRPIAVLEALRRVSGRFSVFCQQGQIKVPRQQHRLYSYLEPFVIEVQPNDKNGVFHPKIWAIRYSAGEHDPILYRMLCLSRNLTFDRSWDTVLVLEGKLNQQRKLGYQRNRLLGEFIAELPSFAKSVVSPDIKKHVTQMAEELRRVQFELPAGLSETDRDDVLQFVPLGTSRVGKAPSFEDCKRLLVVSPFLSDKWVKDLAKLNAEIMLISRQDTLDALRETTYEKLKKADIQLYIMDASAEKPEDVIGADAEYRQDNDDPMSANESDATELAGLHAKLYVAEYGKRDVYLWTGSANATNAGFEHQNVEFMVRLYGKASCIGIDGIIGAANDDSTKKEVENLRQLMCKYQRAETPSNDNEEQAIDDIIEQVRRVISRADLKLVATENEDQRYTLALFNDGKPLDLSDVTASCAPITMNKSAARLLSNFKSGEPVMFFQVPLVDLTSFIAFYLKIKRGDTEKAIEFVLNLPVSGFPTDRNEKILHSIIDSPDRFLSYLSLLLSGETPETDPLAPRKPAEPCGVGFFGDSLSSLFEQLVRAYSRRPEQIDRIDALVRDFQQHSERAKVIPEEFLALWKSFKRAKSSGGEK